eukprot:TRINITY_DN1228_c0_g1_i1.p2 TRINITY_DN1228_c0_g1~~TRINITY_DN1228_c0_g1_i1.p2  ORF type:complete len:139 (-),score=12.21 TRINITY_DN1228_c0_g1_i1:434-850(-)
MGGGDAPLGAQEASPQQDRPSSPESSRMSKGRHEEQLQALQDRLDDETARRMAAEAEVIRCIVPWQRRWSFGKPSKSSSGPGPALPPKQPRQQYQGVGQLLDKAFFQTPARCLDSLRKYARGKGQKMGLLRPLCLTMV